MMNPAIFSRAAVAGGGLPQQAAILWKGRRNLWPTMRSLSFVGDHQPKIEETSKAGHVRFQCHFCGVVFSSFSFHCPNCGLIGPSLSRPNPVSPGSSNRNREESSCIPLDSINPFDVFECVMSYDVDTDSLKREFREKMKSLHPDKVLAGGGGPTAVQLAADHSSLVSFALEVLSNPVKRAVALLKWKYQKDALTEEARITDQNLLLEVLEDMEDAEPTSRSMEELQYLLAKWECRRQNLENRVQQDFNVLSETVNPENRKIILDQIQETLESMQLINRLLDKLRLGCQACNNKEQTPPAQPHHAMQRAPSVQRMASI